MKFTLWIESMALGAARLSITQGIPVPGAIPVPHHLGLSWICPLPSDIVSTVPGAIPVPHYLGLSWISPLPSDIVSKFTVD